MRLDVEIAQVRTEMIIAELEFPRPFAPREWKAGAEIAADQVSPAVQSHEGHPLGVQLPAFRPGLVLRAITEDADVGGEVRVPGPADLFAVTQRSTQPRSSLLAR